MRVGVIIAIVVGCVLVLIAGLAAVLLPALNTARDKACLAGCRNNLHQISMAVEMYRMDYDEYPPWLSNMQDYLKVNKVCLCPADPDEGRGGNMPPWRLGDEPGVRHFPETWDFDWAKAAAEAADLGYAWDDEAGACQSPGLQGNSYLYELCAARCSWWAGERYPDPNNPGRFFDAGDERVDVNGDRKVSWREARMFEWQAVGLEQTPLVSCYWHTRHKDGPALHVAAGHRTVYRSGPAFEDWKYADED
jgi:hypothetical protein